VSSLENAVNTPKLSSLQISMLRLFSQDISETQTLEIRKLLMDYFDKQLRVEIEKVEIEKGYTKDDYVRMLNEKS
jgi:hypothetical protein